MAHGATQFFEGDLFTGDGLDHVGPGDEHVTALANHEYEVGHGRRVHGPTGARSEDDRDLRDDAAGLHVAVEDAAVARQRHHTFLDTGSGTVVQTDDRCAHLQGQIHQLVDLLGEHFAEGAAEHGEVL